MPTVQIHLLEGRTIEQKRAMVDKVTKAICETANCPPEAVKIILDEMKFDNYAEAGVLRADKK
jgi:4-oxalocrotonate tautomerase